MRLLYSFLVLCLVFAPALAEESKKEKRLEWHTRDLYYHDANGMMVQMELAPKLSVRFSSEMTKEARTFLLAPFSPISEVEQPGDSSRILVAFHSSVAPADLLQTANKISASGKAEVAPVFFVDNIEAVLEGIVVESKIVTAPSRMRERMRKYGDFISRQILNENGTWVFLVDEVKPPLNLLVLTNLVSKDSWVQRAYPRFKFLHDPILATIAIEPVSGTVAEMRTVTFTIKIFDPSISLATERLPEFGRGLFMPIQGDVSTPQSVRYPPGYLFEQVGDPLRLPVRQEKRSRTYITSWKFRHYALGEWIITPQAVPYSKKGVDQEIRSSSFTMVVNSQIGNLKITDVPVPRSLIHPSEKLVAIPEVVLPPIPSYWFDAWLSKPELVVRGTRILGILLAVLVLAGAGFVLADRKSRSKRQMVQRRQAIAQAEESLKEAFRLGSYAKYEDALSTLLVVLFPHLTSSPTWEEIKDDKLVLDNFGGDNMQFLEEIFTELGRRHMRDFSPMPEEVERLDSSIEAIFEMADRLSNVRKEMS